MNSPNQDASDSKAPSSEDSFEFHFLQSWFGILILLVGETHKMILIIEIVTLEKDFFLKIWVIARVLAVLEKGKEENSHPFNIFCFYNFFLADPNHLV